MQKFTPTQNKIVLMIADGYSNAEIASLLAVTERSVEKIVSRIHSVIGTKSRANLMTVLTIDRMYKEMPPQAAEQMAIYYGDLKLRWNQNKGLKLQQWEIRKIVEVQTFILKYHSQFCHYLTSIPVEQLRKDMQLNNI